MNKKITLISFLSALMVVSAFTPPLPEGAYPEWGYDKAWKTESALRETVCINGLWKFRSAPQYQDEVIVATTHELKMNGPESMSRWVITPPSHGTIQASYDPSQHTAGNGALKIDLDIPPNENLYHVHTMLNNVPTQTKLNVRLDVLNQVKIGTIQIEIQDSRHWQYFCHLSNEIPVSDKWQTIDLEITLPADTKEIKLIACRNRGKQSNIKGTVWFDNLRIVQIERPVVKNPKIPVDDKWGFAKVPAIRNEGVFYHDDDPGRENPANRHFAWYRRDITIPKFWEKRRIFLDFERLTTNAIVFCRNKKVGELGYQGGSLDITEYAKPGEVLPIYVFIQSRNSTSILPRVIKRSSHHPTAINGDVFLRSLPKENTFEDCTIITDTEQKTITVKTSLARRTNENLHWRCDVHDGDTLVKTFFGKVKGDQLIAEDQWTDVIPWEPATPKLYTLTLSCFKGVDLVDQTTPIRFGFRDFKIKGKFFYLNGIKFNLTPCAYWPFKGNWHTKDAMRHWIKKAKAAGYNYVYIEDATPPGRPDANPNILEVCDEEGMLVGLGPLPVTGFFSDIDEPNAWDDWTMRAERDVRRVINHPSLVMWRMNMNGNCYAQDQNPLLLDGKMEFTPGSLSAKKEYAMLKSNAFIRLLDPTRPTYNHACGKIGELYTLNNYLGWPEQQDLREWIRVWAQNGDKPLFMVEHAIPYPGDFQMRDPRQWWQNEPVMTEYGAIQLGEKAYDLEEDDYVDYLSRQWHQQKKVWYSSYPYFCDNYPPILDICSSRVYEVLIPAWRTWGISGGVNAWENCWRRLIKKSAPGAVGQVPPSVPLKTDWENLQRPGYDCSMWVYDPGGGGEIRTLHDLGRPEEAEYFQPTLRSEVMPQILAPLYAYIGGPDDQWFAQDHTFRTGEAVGKSVILLNDNRKPVTFNVQWRCVMDGQAVASGKEDVVVQPGESGRSQIKFTAPKVANRTAAQIEATVKVDDKWLNVKPFVVQFYPPRAKRNASFLSWGLLDATGKTTEAFSRAGIKIPKLDPDKPIPLNLQVLAIGCESLDKIRNTQALKDLPRLVDRGLTVIVFEQTAKALSDTFGFRAFTPGSRQLWIRQPNHAILNGLVNEDLADWRGATSLGPLAGPPASLDTEQRWKRVWRCSQLGVVASTIVEKPHQTSVHPLVDTGFDLRYMALWETFSGSGRMIFCQLDITDRIAKDAVADKIFTNLAAYAMTPSTVQTRSVADIAALPKQPQNYVLQLKRGCKPQIEKSAEALKDFVLFGGTIVASGLSMDDAQALIAATGNRFAVKLETHWKNHLDSTRLPAVFAGISPAEIHWRRKLEAPVVSEVPNDGWKSDTGVIADIPIEKGRIVWLSAAANDFDPEWRKDMVFTRVKTERLLTTVLANCGIESGLSWTAFFGPDAKNGDQTLLYTDTRVNRDDPYADMRW